MNLTKEALQVAVTNSKSYSEILRVLGLTVNGRNIKTVKAQMFDFNISDSHLCESKQLRQKQNIEYYLVQDSKSSRTHIKNKLLKLGLKQDTCEICGQLPVWNKKPLTMILDHINGINNDNHLENLRIICPNCNYQLETTSRRKKVVKSVCKCGNPIFSSKKVYCSKECHHLYGRTAPRPEKRKYVRPSYEEVLSDLVYKSISEIAIKYKVSGNTIRKWLKKYQISK